MNYGISGENDETDIEFKNLSTIDQTQTFFLDLNKNWLSVKSQKDSKDGKSDFSKTEFKVSDSITKTEHNKKRIFIKEFIKKIILRGYSSAFVAGTESKDYLVKKFSRLAI